jgi:hypothetical protein
MGAKGGIMSDYKKFDGVNNGPYPYKGNVENKLEVGEFYNGHGAMGRTDSTLFIDDDGNLILQQTGNGGGDWKLLSRGHKGAWRKTGAHSNNKNLQHVMECKDGASECTVCGGKEDYLTLDCYGQRLNKHQILYIKHNREDFYNGDWVDTRGQYHIAQQGTEKPFCGSSLPYPDVWVDLESATTSSFIERYSRVTCEKCKRAVS